ncbi:hypothetical protein, partial [Promicromonospora sp. NPDC060271]|uniref:hypothetical protein n=1 Tax=Promicromonospora sp. NPDC060271 TaxID=3347089 RepID=UPI0036673349
VQGWTDLDAKCRPQRRAPHSPRKGEQRTEQGPRDQAEAAFDVLDPLDDDPEVADEPEEPDDPDDEDDDPELSADEALDEPEEDSDLPGFTVLVVDVLRESVR